MNELIPVDRIGFLATHTRIVNLRVLEQRGFEQPADSPIEYPNSPGGSAGVLPLAVDDAIEPGVLMRGRMHLPSVRGELRFLYRFSPNGRSPRDSWCSVPANQECGS